MTCKAASTPESTFPTPALTFEPKYHVQVADGENAGAWVARLCLGPPLTGSTPPTTFIRDQIAEGARITAQGGTILCLDAKADPALSAAVMAALRDATSTERQQP